VENLEVPLAAWRVYGAAEKLHHLRSNTKRANVCQYKKQQVTRKLIESLSDSDPLREHLWSLTGMNIPAVIDGAVKAIPPQADFNSSLVSVA
jgi:hypothetical protein